MTEEEKQTNEIFIRLKMPKAKGIIFVVEGDQITYRYIGMMLGESIDRLSDVRASMLSTHKDTK